MKELTNRLNALKQREIHISEQITQESSRCSSDDLKIQELKKQRLKLQEEIEQIEKEF